jgi:Peptidase M60, enhancin and enhancin-like/N-terminal domain of M60-like peptidases
VPGLDASGGTDSRFVTAGPGAFPLYRDPAGNAGVVGARYPPPESSPLRLRDLSQWGRVVAFGHMGFLRAPSFNDTVTPLGRFMTRALRWAAGLPCDIDSNGLNDPFVEILVHRDAALEVFRTLGPRAFPGPRGFQFTFDGVSSVLSSDLPAPTWFGNASASRMVVVAGSVQYRNDAAERNRLRDFLRAGGGVLTSGLVWAYELYNPYGTERIFPANLLLGPECGVAFDSGYSLAPKTAVNAGSLGEGDNPLWAALALANTSIARTNLEKVSLMSNILTSNFVADWGDAIAITPDLRQNVPAAVGNACFSAGLPTTPLYPNASADVPSLLSRHCVRVISKFFQFAPAGSFEAVGFDPDSAASIFPGVLNKSRPTNGASLPATIFRPIRSRRFHSTGFYAGPGAPVTLNISTAPALASRVLARMQACIGTQTNDMAQQSTAWERWPRLMVCAKLDPVGLEGIGKAQVSLASVVGGMLYVDVTDGAWTIAGTVLSSGNANMTVSVDGGLDLVPALHFSDALTPCEWQIQLAERTWAPWGEVEGQRVALQLTSTLLGAMNYSDVLGVSRFWDNVVLWSEDLFDAASAAYTYRIAFDTQQPETIRQGYPINVRISAGGDEVAGAATPLGDNKNIMRELSGPAIDQRFAIMGDGSLKLLAVVYTLEQMSGSWDGFLNLTALQGAVRAYKQNPNFATLQNNDALSLMFYVELQQAFSWCAFRDVFARYHDTRLEGANPASGTERIDLFLTELSHVVGYDLSSYFDEWEIPRTVNASASYLSYPTWSPGASIGPSTCVRAAPNITSWDAPYDGPTCRSATTVAATTATSSSSSSSSSSVTATFAPSSNVTATAALSSAPVVEVSSDTGLGSVLVPIVVAAIAVVVVLICVGVASALIVARKKREGVHRGGTQRYSDESDAVELEKPAVQGDDAYHNVSAASAYRNSPEDQYAGAQSDDAYHNVSAAGSYHSLQSSPDPNGANDQYHNVDGVPSRQDTQYHNLPS